MKILKFIYIPIWWYSNAAPAALPGAVKLFTFQYGDIQIVYVNSCIFLFAKFTFQYGDIQIKARKIWDNSSYRIYIPIWWYSNVIKVFKGITDFLDLHSNMVIFKFVELRRKRMASGPFTFQYGDIQIK